MELIAPSKLANTNVEGYEIHLSGEFNDETRKYLNKISIEKKLAIVQHPDSIMLYTAKKIETKTV
jgi:hypothetical protein